jgi:hypothetical protein
LFRALLHSARPLKKGQSKGSGTPGGHFAEDIMRIRLAVCSLIVALVGAVVATPALAQGRGRDEAKQGQGRAKKAAPPARATVVVQYGFTPRDREIITRYYTQRASGLPPGLAKRQGALPPGLEKQIRRNGTLPPGLQKQIQPFPADLDRQLTRLPDGYLRVIVGTDVAVYRSTTQKIMDVIRDIVR